MIRNGAQWIGTAAALPARALEPLMAWLQKVLGMSRRMRDLEGQNGASGALVDKEG